MEFVLSELAEHVMAARAAHKPMRIRGGGTKDFYGEIGTGVGPNGSAVLDVTAYRGIISYEPSELVITARAGTPLHEIEDALRQQGQMLAFEPPRFGQESTIGGCVASGLSGPRRMAAGSLGDFVLGVRLLDSAGNLLRFGGEVMKNVAGYDVSRLLAGSMGILGVLAEVSIKVAPLPFCERTLRLSCRQEEALARMNQWRSQPLPISASAWSGDDGGQLHIRLSGSDAAVRSAQGKTGGEPLDQEQAAQWWDDLRDQRHAFFRQRPLWRLAVPPKSPALGLGPTLVEWNGGLRWIAGETEEVTEEGARRIRDVVASAGGHATLYRYDRKPAGVPVFQTPDAGIMAINRRLKNEFDPMGIFNSHRLYAEF